MSDIVKYAILDPIPDKSKPFFDNKTDLFYIPTKTDYNWYVASYIDNQYGGVDYFLLLGKTKFNSHCRRCNTDQYGRTKLKLKGELYDYVRDTCEVYGNIEIEYVESAEDYDVFSVHQ